MSISFSGLGSGIDTASIIEQMVYVARTPIRKLTVDVSNAKSRSTIIQNINSKLQALQTQANDLKTLSSFMANTVKSSDESVLTATATGNALPGNYTVEVLTLAKAQRTYSSTFDNKTEAGTAGSGQLTVTVGSSDGVVIEVEESDSLESIANKINASGAEVTAGIFYDGSQYRLQITGKETGAANAITFEESEGLSLGLQGATNFQNAQDASLKIDGFDITSSTNQIKDAVSGVTLDLKTETTSPIQITVDTDPTTMKSKIEKLVSAYNDVAKIINSELSFAGEAKGANRLAGDATLRNLQSALSSIVAGRSDEGGTFSSLSQLGISTQRDGSLSVNSAKLDAALASDPVGVGTMFAGATEQSDTGFADKFSILVDRFINSSSGILTAKKKGLDSSVQNLNDAIDKYETRMTTYEEKLRMQFTKLETAMSTLNSQSSFMASQISQWQQ